MPTRAQKVLAKKALERAENAAVPSFPYIVAPKYLWHDVEVGTLKGTTTFPDESYWKANPENCPATLLSPSFRTEDGRFVRLHELLHARFTHQLLPHALKLEKKGAISQAALQLAEDMRLAYLADTHDLWGGRRTSYGFRERFAFSFTVYVDKARDIIERVLASRGQHMSNKDGSLADTSTALTTLETVLDTKFEDGTTCHELFIKNRKAYGNPGDFLTFIRTILARADKAIEKAFEIDLALGRRFAAIEHARAQPTQRGVKKPKPVTNRRRLARATGLYTGLAVAVEQALRESLEEIPEADELKDELDELQKEAKERGAQQPDTVLETEQDDTLGQDEGDDPGRPRHPGPNDDQDDGQSDDHSDHPGDDPGREADTPGPDDAEEDVDPGPGDETDEVEEPSNKSPWEGEGTSPATLDRANKKQNEVAEVGLAEHALQYGERAPEKPEPVTTEGMTLKEATYWDYQRTEELDPSNLVFEAYDNVQGDDREPDSTLCLAPVGFPPHSRLDDVRWARMQIHRPERKLPNRALVKTMGRASLEGGFPKHWNRWTTDKHVLNAIGRRPGGTLLIDVSGSMSWAHEDTLKLIEIAPASTIALYAGKLQGLVTPEENRSGAPGLLTIIAYAGRVVGPEFNHRLLHSHSNIVDGPALSWLARQARPRIWFSDGRVTGIRRNGTDQMSTRLDEDAFRIAHRGIITRTTDFEEVLEIFEGRKPEHAARLEERD